MQRRSQHRRPLLRPQLRDGGLAWASRTQPEQRIRTRPAPGRSSIGSTHRPRSPRPSAGSKTAIRCSSAANSSTATATTSRRSTPAPAEPLAVVSTASAADVDTAVGTARNAYDGSWSRLSGAERGKYLFRIARGIAERARELAVVETLDNGKPIKESRDVDVPTAAAHFFYHAGWADKLGTPASGPTRSRSAWSGRSSRGTSRC